MTPVEWNRLLSAVGKRKNKRDWKALLGDAFQPLDPCLCKTGDHVRAVGCDLCTCNHEVFPDKDGNGFVAHCRCDDRGCADIHLKTTDAEAWEFSGMALGETLGRALVVASGSVVRDEGTGLFDIGECPRHPERAHVWFCACPERLLAERLAALLQRKAVGCVVVPEGSSAVHCQAAHAGVAVLPVGACFSFGKEGVSGNCGERCKKGAMPLTPLAFRSAAENSETVYAVGGKYRIEDGCSRVVTLKTKEAWSVPPFTRVVLEVMLTDARAGGLTSEVIYQAAVSLYRERFPELAKGDKGRNSDVVKEKPLKQYFQIKDKTKATGKATHGLFQMITSSGGKKPSYAFKKGTVKTTQLPD